MGIKRFKAPLTLLPTDHDFRFLAFLTSLSLDGK